ncbi:pilus assembly protein CpaE [Caulobacter vibrioides]|uniref:Pilus assembly protein CpaE n=1 Tax=Caulobacter vibrioides TaxID=155892 RepID=A0A290MGK5_CAUVI|nr:pilus assembly protein CpaE [Caulobacter vibrioides]ATC30940.1 pilus assembly protein CpaE [Caulobacter vibrioides]
MRPTDNDPFDLGFDAADEFTTGAGDPWRSSAPSLTPAGGFEDPFADFPPARPREDTAPPARSSQVAPPTTRPTPQARPAQPPAPAPSVNDYDDRSLDIPAGASSAPAPAYDEPIADSGLGDAVIPRITIHAFCARPETAALIEKAAADRRMSRAATIVRDGGLEAAVDYYQNQPTPSLVMVETLDGAQRLLHLLDSLAQVCDPGTKVVVVGQTNDIALYRELMRRGVSEYLTQPLGPLQVIRAVGALYADPAAPFTGRQIAFVGAKGGVGASTLAHNFAWAMAEKMQTATVLVDLDLAFGTAGLDFNQDPLQGVLDALSQPDRLDPVLMDRMMVRCADRLSLFAAPASLDDDYEFGADAFEEVTQKIRGAAPFVVLDLPHVWNAWSRRVLIGSDELVVVATPDLASLRNAKNIIDLVRGSRPNDAPPRLVLNQVGVPGRPEIPVKDFGEALGVQPSLVLPFDPKPYGQAANNGQMLAEVAPKSKAAEGLEHLARLISRREPPPAQKTSMFSGLFKKK